ncbi:MAG: phage Gp37/Gp68 family protein [Bacteroidales bacterium]|jgi:protein gp37|nr:phage Gp37/Gp68 family protein [Bacteroidales bacterium]
MASIWNPWHGCHKLSAGCKHCYVYRGDQKLGIDSRIVTQTKNFDLPVRKKKNGDYKLTSGTEVFTCFTSDFFVEDADQWRKEAWQMIRERNDLKFTMITKRIDRLHVELPADWETGYEHVTICCTVENQAMADYRLPLYVTAPIKHKIIICEPILERINLRPHIGPWIEQVVVGGESGNEARICDFDWVMEIRQLCLEHDISFWFKQTGSKLVKDGSLYHIKRHLQHSQARKAGINHRK